MKKFSKVFLNFLVCWSMLFGQMVHGSETESGGGWFSYLNYEAFANLSIWDIFSSDDEEEAGPSAQEAQASATLTPGSTVANSSVNRTRARGTRYRPTPPPTAPEPTPERSAASLYSLTTAGCGFVDGISADTPGISSLSNYLNEALCSPQTVRDLASLENNGAIDAVDVCRQLQLYRQYNTCNSDVLTPGGVFAMVEEQRTNAQMRELEVAEHAKVLEEEAQQLGDIMKMQTAMATDVSVMNYLYHRIKNRYADNTFFRENLGPDFFSPGNNTSLSDFTKAIFKCLPDSPGLDGTLDAGNLCSGSPSYDPSISRDALSNLINNGCQEMEQCFLQGMMDGDSLPDLVNILEDNVGREIIAESGGTGNIALFDQNIGLSALDNTLDMMSFYNNDAADIGGGHYRLGVVSAVIEGIEGLEGEQRVNQARRVALNYSLELIRNNSNMLSGPEGSAEFRRRQYFDGFISHITNDGLLSLEGYSSSDIERALREYGSIEGNVDLFTAGEEGAALTSEIENIVALVQRAATGQQMGNYVVYSQQQIAAVLNIGANENQSRPSNPSVWGQVGSYVSQMQQTLGLPSGAAQDSAAQNIMTEMHRDVQGRLPILNAAARMLSHRSYHDGQVAQELYGMRSALEIFREALPNPNEGDTQNARTIQNAGLEGFAAMAILSIKKCGKQRSERRLKRRLCSPMASPEYGRQALENVLNADQRDRSGSEMLNEALLYCTPILAESNIRSALQRAEESGENLNIRSDLGRLCDTQTQAIFCGESCSRLGDEVHVAQNLLFGRECDGRISARGTLDPTSTDAPVPESRKAGSGPEDGSGTIAIEVLPPDEQEAIQRQRPPRTKSASFDRGLSVSNSLRGSGLGNIDSGSGQAFSETAPSVESANLSRDSSVSVAGDSFNAALKTSAMEGAQGPNNQAFNGQSFTPQINPATNDLSETLREQEGALDPASRALLSRLEEMEARQAALQRELDESRARLDQADDEERAELLAELRRLKEEIPRLEDELREREDVNRAIAQATPTPAPAQESPSAPSASFGGGSFSASPRASRGPASVSAPAVVNNPTNAPAPVEATPDNSGSFNPGVASVRSSGGGPEYVSAAGSGFSGSGGEGLYTSQTVLQLTEAIRSSARVYPPGVVPSEAVLEAGGAILIPLDEEGQFIMYEPEMTLDGQIRTENGEVVFKAIVQVSDEEVRQNAGRIPASLEPDAESELPADYDPRRLKELNQTLDILEVTPEQ